MSEKQRESDKASRARVRRGSGGPMGHMMRPKQRAKDARGTVMRIWGYLERRRRPLIITAALVVISSVLGVLSPYLMGQAIDALLIDNDVRKLGWLALAMLGVYLSTSVISWLQTYVMTAASQQAVTDIRNDLFAKLQTLSLRFFDQRTHGELMSRLTNDVESISTVLNSGVIQLISNSLSLIGVAAMMLILNVRLAIVTLITVPLMVSLSRWIAKRTRSGFRKRQAYLGELNSIIEESISGQTIRKAWLTPTTKLPV